MNFPLGATDTTKENQRIVMQAVNQLKKLGHAISYDSTEDHMQKFLNSRVLHFKTCRACLEMKDAK